MKRINNKGFTLVELIATIVLLAIIMGIGAVSITAVIKNSQEKNYKLLINEIINSVELYYQECRFIKDDLIGCPTLDENDYYHTTLGDLVSKGFLKGNGTDSEKNFTLVDPNNEENNITGCEIKYKYTGGKLLIEASPETENCPTNIDYNQ